jgi:hypothetical protein
MKRIKGWEFKWMGMRIASREVCIMMWFGGSEKEKVKERS